MLLVRKPEGKRPPGTPRWGCLDNIKMDLGDVGLGGLDWIGLAQEGSCEHATEPSGSIKCWNLRE
jgi:hypothetical protein